MDEISELVDFENFKKLTTSQFDAAHKAKVLASFLTFLDTHPDFKTFYELFKMTERMH